jgi:hypothetical protein
MSYQAGSPPLRAPKNRISRFIMLSMMTRKSEEAGPFHERVARTIVL